MVKTDIDQNPLDPNYEKRRSSLGNMEHQQQDQSNVKDEDLMGGREVAPSSRVMCSELAHQHAVDSLNKKTGRRSSQDVDHNSFLSDLSTDRGLQAHPEQLEE
ncbi:RPEL repeat protein [Penicillium digitatum]|uniref:RPEL repeat protein n=3 Tax=Penicillium digitatum TaxID=36651 RepID=K9GHD3_PEND2|nr:RPEL repeat protein [Penicillium digitatum Pd1]EKV11977.1 RPEL repeat protein [Penicillium digitatum Pd1]EKV14153.1 RPEL repeat protein [Penicillium digitatum PHI26]QQK43046.1 RPEL repeat protein [Penicillium digitatum]